MSTNDRGAWSSGWSMLIAVGILIVVVPRLGALFDQRPSVVRAVYAVPAGDAVDPTMAAAIRNEVGVVQRWLEEETGGRSLRFAEEDGRVAVQVRHLEASARQIQAHRDPFTIVHDELLDGKRSDELLLVFVPVTLWAQHLCGEGSTIGLAVVWGRGCSGGPIATSSTMGHGATYVIAHELVHALGGVRPCAPNYDSDGHVDDVDDVIASNHLIVYDRRGVQLDPGRDDYYDTGNSCGDIADHPAWR